MTDHKIGQGTIAYGQDPSLEEQIRIAKVRIANEMILIESLEKKKLENEIRLKIQEVTPVVKDSKCPRCNGFGRKTDIFGNMFGYCPECMGTGFKEPTKDEKPYACLKCGARLSGLNIENTQIGGTIGCKHEWPEEPTKPDNIEDKIKHAARLAAKRGAEPDDLERLKQYIKEVQADPYCTIPLCEGLNIILAKIQSIQEGKYE